MHKNGCVWLTILGQFAKELSITEINKIYCDSKILSFCFPPYAVSYKKVNEGF